MAPRNDFKAHRPGDRATMPPRNNSMIRKQAKPATKHNKTAWETHKDTIIKLYRIKTLEDVISEMEGKGFRANKRQYVYRLSEWGERKYNPLQPEADHGENNDFPGNEFQDLDGHVGFTSSQDPHGQASPSSPVFDAQQHWLAKMKLRADSQLVLPKNTAAFSDYKRLYDGMPPGDEGTPLYGAVVDACVFSALADHIDPDDKSRVNAIIAGIRCDATSQGGVDQLRCRLQIHALGAHHEGNTARTSVMVDEFFKKPHINNDLNMFLLLTFFGPCYGLGQGAINHEKRTLYKYVQSLQKNQEAQRALSQGIKWCRTICDETTDIPLELGVKPSNSNEQVQLDIAEVSCLLFAKLLLDNEEEPQWAKNIEANLGISKITFAVTLVCMARANSGPWFGLPGITPSQRVSHGLDMLTNEGTAKIWQLFLEAFVQVHKTAYMGHTHTLSQSAMDQSPCSDDFVKNLRDAVDDFMTLNQPSELSDSPSSLGQVGSVFGDPSTPLQQAEDIFYTQDTGASMGDDSEFGYYYGGCPYPNTFEVSKGLNSYPLAVTAEDTGMGLIQTQAPYMSSQ